MISCDCTDAVTADCSVDFEGIPAILLEVTDNPDPVEVGTTTTYTIQVTNQGSATDNNIRVVATLPASQSYVSAGGPTTASTSAATPSPSARCPRWPRVPSRPGPSPSALKTWKTRASRSR